MKYFLILSVFLSEFSDLIAQDTTRYWKRSVTTTLNFSQVSLTNWVGGGQSSVSLTGLVNGFANYSKKKFSWTNSIDLGYGLVKIGQHTAFRKSDDKIIFTTKAGHQMHKHLKLSVLLDFRTQFAPGYKYSNDSLGKEHRALISRFLAPAYLLTAIGVEYDPTENIYFFVSPLTIKNTIVMKDSLSNAGAFGVPPGRYVRNEFGAYFATKGKFKIMENITFQTSLNLFSNYQYFGVIDVNWDAILLMKVNKYINVSVSTNLFYDQDIQITRKDQTVGPAVQFKEVLALGFAYTVKQK
ncbi:MAG TPA: DUF3078 domain-containing protein [Cytophagaceae bacterium]|jgi:hypothetical protein|nr:DUF3078 domain-containing protein [Cytophagaceae bacterium]